MSQPKIQTYANHARFDPLFHYVALPFLLLNWIASIVFLVRHPSPWHLWQMLLAFILILILGVARSSALRAQDRTIRLEERLRLATLLQEPTRARISELSTQQLVALRFASDAEIPALVARTLNENLSQKQIKEAIQTWRPDYCRV